MVKTEALTVCDYDPSSFAVGRSESATKDDA